MSSKNNQDRSGRRNQLSLSGNSPKYQQSQKLDAGLNGQETNGASKKEKMKTVNYDSEKITTNNDVQKLKTNQAIEIEQVDLSEKTNANKLPESNGKKQTEIEKQSIGKQDPAGEVIVIDDIDDLVIQNKSIETETNTSTTQSSSKSNNSCEVSVPTEVLEFSEKQSRQDVSLKHSEGAKSATILNAEEEDATKVIAIAEPTSTINIDPAATSTPGKFGFGKATVDVTKLPYESDSYNVYPRSYNQISGRRSIRSFTPGCHQGKPQSMESYRQINTELDVSSITDISTNATLGSEVHNNSSFSFFGFGRKRERASSNSQLNQDFQIENETTPQKRARIDKSIFYSVISSPFKHLATQFSKANIKNDTPKNQETLSGVEEPDDVQNVSGTSITDSCTKNKNEEVSQQEEKDNNFDVLKNNEKDNSATEKVTDISMENEKANESDQTVMQDPDKPQASNDKAKRCSIM